MNSEAIIHSGSAVAGAMLHGNPEWMAKKHLLLYRTIIVSLTGGICLVVVAHVLF